MVFTLFGLHTRRASHNGCRGIITFFYTHLTNHYLNSAGHTFLFITTNGQASADTDKIRDTARDIYIYIYEFSRRFYPKRLTLHSSYSFYILSALWNKRDFSKSQHSEQNKRFLATATALNINETSKYTYELLLTSADRVLLSKRISLHCFLLALEHTSCLSQ